MKCFWGAGHHRWKLKFLGAWLLPCQYPWLLPWISAWSLMPWVLPCHKTSGSMAFAMQPSMVFITTSTTPHLYKACWGWKSESYINSISVDLLRVDWKKKKRISRLPTAERRGWALVHSSFVAPLGCFTPELVERSKIGKTDGNRRTWYLGLGRYVTSGIKFSLCNFLDFRRRMWEDWCWRPPTILWWCKKNFKAAHHILGLPPVLVNLLNPNSTPCVEWSYGLSEF